MENSIQVFKEQEVLGKPFRMYGTPEEPLFLAKDVAEWIEYDVSSVNKLIVTVDDDEKVRKNVPTLGGPQESWFLTEDGLYEVLMQSRKPIAKQFKTEVKAILKTIRKHGMYATDSTIEKVLTDPDFGIKLLTELKSERAARMQAEKANFALQRELNLLEGTNSVIRIGDLVHEIRCSGRMIVAKELFAWMRENGYITRTPFGHAPTPFSLKNGLMIERQTPHPTIQGAVLTLLALVTAKGQRYFLDLWKPSVKTMSSNVEHEDFQ